HGQTYLWKQKTQAHQLLDNRYAASCRRTHPLSWHVKGTDCGRRGKVLHETHDLISSTSEKLPPAPRSFRFRNHRSYDPQSSSTEKERRPGCLQDARESACGRGGGMLMGGTEIAALKSEIFKRLTWIFKNERGA
ncbi:unnamed protein product, partial [Scytosiphon promiscuus]